MSTLRKLGVFAASFCLSALLWTQSADAAQVTVKEGDTLWAIASRSGTTVQTIKNLNNLTSDSLKIGQTLNLPDGAVDSQASQQAARPLAAPPNASRGMVDRALGVLDYAKQFMGVRYRSGGESPNGFDCSGYVRYVFKNFGFDLVHTAAGQAQTGTAVKRGELRPGDLVFFNTSGYGINHSGIYVGNDQFIHASTSRGIRIDSLHDGYWNPKYRGATRLL